MIDGIGPTRSVMSQIGGDHRFKLDFMSARTAILKQTLAAFPTTRGVGLQATGPMDASGEPEPIMLTPGEARQISILLFRLADEAERRAANESAEIAAAPPPDAPPMPIR